MNFLKTKSGFLFIWLLCPLMLIAQRPPNQLNTVYPFYEWMELAKDWETGIQIRKEIHQVLTDTAFVADSSFSDDSSKWRFTWMGYESYYGSISMSQPHFVELYFQSTDSCRFFTGAEIFQEFAADTIMTDSLSGQSLMHMFGTTGTWSFLRAGDYLVVERTLNSTPEFEMLDFGGHVRYIFRRESF